MKLKKIALVFFSLVFLAALPACSKKSDVPSGMAEVKSEYTDFRFFVPDDWTADISNGFVSAYASDGSNVSVQTLSTDGIYSSENGYVIKKGGTSYNGVSEYFDKYYFPLITSTFSSVVLKEQYTQNQSLGENTYACKYVYDVTADGITYTVMQILAPKNYEILVLTYTAKTKQYDSHLSEITKITENFRFE